MSKVTSVLIDGEHDPATCWICRIPEELRVKMHLLGIKLAFDLSKREYVLIAAHPRRHGEFWVERGMFNTPFEWERMLTRFVAWRDGSDHPGEFG